MNQSPTRPPAALAPTPSVGPAPSSPPVAADAHGVRPMSLAPTTATAGPATAPASGMGLVTAASDSPGDPPSSGSGGNPTISNANITLTQTGDDAQGRHYKVDLGGAGQADKLPVGKIVSVMLMPPTNSTFQTITWAGGTDYKSYYKGAAKTEAPTVQRVTTGVATNQATYSFIVDPNPRLYSIKATVTYVVGGGGAADFSFTSVRPDVQLTPTLGTPKLLLSPNVNDPNGGAVAVRLDNSTVAPPDTKEVAGMRIDAETTAKEFGGQFMFMQLTSPVRVTQRLDDAKFRQSVAVDTWAIDNSFTSFQGATRGGAVGYPITDNDNNDGNFYFRISNPGETETHTMGDNPVTPQAFMSNKTLQVGDVGANRPEKFDAYVMYKATQDDTAAWVAIGKVHWEWGALAGNNADGDGGFLGGLPANWALSPFPNVPPPKVTTPVGSSEYFPAWTDRATDILGRGTGGWSPF